MGWTGEKYYIYHSDQFIGWFVIENEGDFGTRYSGPYMKQEDAEADAKYMNDGE